jgi:hypothetical protein
MLTVAPGFLAADLQFQDFCSPCRLFHRRTELSIPSDHVSKIPVDQRDALLVYNLAKLILCNRSGHSR